MAIYLMGSASGIGDAIEAFRRLTRGSQESPVTPIYEQEADPELLKMESFCRDLVESQCIATTRCEPIYGDDDFNLDEGVYDKEFITCITSEYYRDYLKSRRYQCLQSNPMLAIGESLHIIKCQLLTKYRDKTSSNI